MLFLNWDINVPVLFLRHMNRLYREGENKMKASKKLIFGKVYKVIIFGVLTAIAMTLLLSLVLTWLIFTKKIGEDIMKYGAYITAFIASFCCAAITVKNSEKQKFINGTAVSAIYFVCLLMSTALFFEGQYQNIIVTMLCVLIGSLLACMLTVKTKRQRVHTNKIRHYR